MAYARGLTGPELGAPQFPDCDRFMGALPLAEPFAALDANDVRMVDTLNVMEEMGTSVGAVREQEEARKKKGLSTDDAWFWNCYAMSAQGLAQRQYLPAPGRRAEFPAVLDELLRGDGGRQRKDVGSLDIWATTRTAAIPTTAPRAGSWRTSATCW